MTLDFEQPPLPGDWLSKPDIEKFLELLTTLVNDGPYVPSDEMRDTAMSLLGLAFGVNLHIDKYSWIEVLPGGQYKVELNLSLYDKEERSTIQIIEEIYRQYMGREGQISGEGKDTDDNAVVPLFLTPTNDEVVGLADKGEAVQVIFVPDPPQPGPETNL